MENRQVDSQSISNQRGQGTVEYILVLTVVVIIALTGFYQFHDAFGKYIDSYFGQYLACLLETGELPNLGAPNGTSCDADFEAFTIENGRPKIVDNSTTGTNGSGNGEDEETGGSGRARRTNNSGSGTFGKNRGGRRGTSEGGGAKKSAAKKDGGSDSSGFNNRKNGNLYSYNNQGKKTQLVAAKNRLGSGKDDETNKKAKAKKKTSVTSKDSGKRGLLIPAKARKPAEELPDDGEPFTFGKFIRYLIIAAIIIAIVLFIGGQALQLSKEWD